jgi:hypothetical protein
MLVTVSESDLENARTELVATLKKYSSIVKLFATPQSLQVTNERQATRGFWDICNLGKVGSVSLHLRFKSWCYSRFSTHFSRRAS